MSLRRKRNIRDFITDEQRSAKDYKSMIKRTNNKEFKDMYKEMAENTQKHLKMLNKILKQEPCEKQNVTRRGRNR